MLKIAAFGILLVVGLAAPLAAKVKLENHPKFGRQILELAMAEEIAANCKSLKFNTVVMSAMPSYFAIGEPSYSEAEFKAALAALRPAAHQALIVKGAVEGKPKSFCAVGKAERRANSVIGRLFM